MQEVDKKAVKNFVSFSGLHMEAMTQAKRASNAFYKDVMNGRDHFPCGFAWVVVKIRSNTKLGKEMIDCGFYKPYGKAGELHLWMTNTLPVQCMDVHETAAAKYAEVLQQNGIQCHWDSRMD